MEVYGFAFDAPKGVLDEKGSPEMPAVAKIAKKTQELSQAKLRSFFNGAGKFPHFSFSRWWWEGKGSRPGIRQAIDKKLCPYNGITPSLLNPLSPRLDVLLPSNAPLDFMYVPHLLDAWDRALPPHEVQAHLQVTLYFPNAQSLHTAFELTRSFAQQFFVVERGLPVIQLLHMPHLAGSANDPHVHLIVLPRRCSWELGFGIFDRHMASDRGQMVTYQAWLDHQREQP